MSSDKKETIKWTTVIGLCVIALLIGALYCNRARDVYEWEQDLRKKDYAQIFATPSDKLQMFNETCRGILNTEIISTSQPITLKKGKSFTSIELDSGALGRKREPWMTHCYFCQHNPQQRDEFQRKNEYLNGDIWVYTDKDFSRAFITGELYYGKSRYGLDRDPEFAKLFKTSLAKINFGERYPGSNEYYLTNSILCCEVYSPLEPLQLQSYLQNIDPKSCTVKFPPGQKTKPWMSKCYYYCQTPSPSKEESWVFTNNKLDHAYIIIKFPESREQNIYRYPKRLPMSLFRYMNQMMDSFSKSKPVYKFAK